MTESLCVESLMFVKWIFHFYNDLILCTIERYNGDLFVWFGRALILRNNYGRMIS